jgi:PAS domain S-box-containing protein
MNAANRVRRSVGLRTALALISVFAIDVFTPRGVADTLLYIPVLMLSARRSTRFSPFAIAAVASVLSVVGYFLSATGNAEVVVVANRVLAMGALWLATVLIVRWARSDHLLTENRDMLEQQVKERERFRLVAEESLTGIYLIEGGVFRYVNPAFARIFGYQVEEIVDRLGPVDLTMPEDRELVAKNLQRRLEGEVEATRYDLRGQRRDGSCVQVEVHGRRTKLDGGTGVVGTLVDVTARKDAEEALRRSEELFRLLAENSNDLITLRQLDGTLVYGSPSFARLLGSPPAPALDQVIEAFHRDDRQMGRRAWEEAASGQSRYSTFRYAHADGNWHWLEAWGTRVDFRGQPHVLSVCRDITEHKRAEEALRESEELFRFLAENSHDIISLYDQDSRRIYVSPSFYRVLGPPPDDAFSGVHPDDLAKAKQAWERAMTGERVSVVVRHMTPSGMWCWLDVLASRVFYHGAPHAMAVSRDITVRQQAEQQVFASLREKEALLKEVHHRVKNNLQLISSLLNLQASRIESPTIREQFSEIRDRVRSMAMVHENLYRTQSFAGVPIAKPLQDLCEHLVRSYATGAPLEITYELSDVALDLDQAVPCVLIVNELVTNTLKHAFPGERAGRLSLELRRGPEEIITLTVADDGVGVPPDFNERRRESLGLHLVEDLTDQLQGQLEIKAGGRGTSITITFPVPSSSTPQP